MFPPRHMQTDVSKIALFSPHSLFSSSSLSHTYLSLVSHISNIISGAVMIDVFDFDRVMIRSSCTLSLIDPCCFRSESFFFLLPLLSKNRSSSKQGHDTRHVTIIVQGGKWEKPLFSSFPSFLLQQTGTWPLQGAKDYPSLPFS